METLANLESLRGATDETRRRAQIRLAAEAIGSDASDHDGKLRFAHCGFSLTVRFMRADGRARG